jgi:GntR family transcriptional regulator
MTIHLRLDPSSPMPLYHQIVQAIRWRIGTGVLRPGDMLPPIREAAKQWGVNYHTVRRAYHDLAQEGWVVSGQGSGTQVAAAQPLDAIEDANTLSDWLDQLVATARQRYGLSAERLAELIGERTGVVRIVMVECNEHQSTYLARQLEQRLPVEAIAWSLTESAEPPQLPLIGTYFHHGEMRKRWPHRIADMHFVTLQTDRALEKRVSAIAARRAIRAVRLVEREIGTAYEMAAGVSALLAPRFEVSPVVGDPEELLSSLPEDELLLVAPRLWDPLPTAVRQHERVLDVRPVIAAEDVQRLWTSLRAASATAANNQ